VRIRTGLVGGNLQGTEAGGGCEGRAPQFEGESLSENHSIFVD